MSQNNQLAVVETAPQRTWAELQNIGQVMFESRMFPDLKSEAQAITKILAGSEYGMQPFEALQNIHIIQGKATLSANAMAMAIKASAKYDYRVLRMDDEAAEVEFYESGVSLGISAFTLEDARKAGTQNIQKYARNMMFARAISNGVRWYAPDVFKTAVYTPEEMGAVVDAEGSVVSAHEEPKSPPRATKEGPRKAAVVTVEEEVETEVDESDLDVFDLQSKSIDELNKRFEEIKASGGKDSPDAAEYKEVFYQIKLRLARGEKPTPKAAPTPVSAVKDVQQKAIQVTEEEAQEIEDIFGSGSGELVDAEIVEIPAVEMIQPGQKQAIMARARKLFGKEDYQSKLAAEIESSYGFVYEADSTKLTVEELTVKQASDLMISLQTRITEAATPKEGSGE